MMARGRYAPPLTATEHRALRLRALGYGAREAANELGVSRNTFYEHIKHAYLRLGAYSLVDALRAIGWLRVPSEDDR